MPWISQYAWMFLLPFKKIKTLSCHETKWLPLVLIGQHSDFSKFHTFWIQTYSGSKIYKLLKYVFLVKVYTCIGLLKENIALFVCNKSMDVSYLRPHY